MDSLTCWCQQNNIASHEAKLREQFGFLQPSELGDLSAPDLEKIIGECQMNFGEQVRFKRAVNQFIPSNRSDFVERTLKSLENARLTPSQLFALGQGIELLYASQANAVVQFLPLDMWRTIFHYSRIAVFPIRVLLGLRTVCRAWHQLIGSYKTINFDERDFEVNKLANIFELEALEILEDSKIDFRLFTQLKELTIGAGRSKGSFFSDDMDILTHLTNLTHLNLTSKFLTRLGPLTSLCSLHLREPCLIKQDATRHLSRLTKLVSEDLHFFQNGKGIYHNAANGDTFDGEFFGGLLVYGVLDNRRQGLRYEGSFRHGMWKPNGRGVLISDANQSQYEGEFRYGAKHGDGVYSCPEFRYEGMYKENKISGLGVLFLHKNGNVYEGEFQEVMSEEGKKITAKGTRFKRTGESKPFEKEFSLN